MLLFFLVGIIDLALCQDSYMQEIQRLQHLVNSGRSRPSRSNHKQKPKKYKCFLVDEDDYTFLDYMMDKSTTAEPTTNRFEWASSNEKPHSDTIKPPVAYHLPSPPLVDESRHKIVPLPLATDEVPPPTPKLLRPLPPPPPQIPQPIITTAAPLPIASITSPPQASQVDPNIPRDSQNRPLILSPQHCSMMKRYADLYGVQDINGWVHNNCAFAKLSK